MDGSRSFSGAEPNVPSCMIRYPSRAPTTAPGTIPTATNATSSGRRSPARAMRPATTSAAMSTPTSAIDPQRTVRSPSSWTVGSKSKVMTAIGTVAMSVSKEAGGTPRPSFRHAAPSWDLSARRHIRCPWAASPAHDATDIIGPSRRSIAGGRSTWRVSRRTSLGAPTTAPVRPARGDTGRTFVSRGWDDDGNHRLGPRCPS